jgi:hypothetical protein
MDSHYRRRFRCCCLVANPAALGSGFGLVSVSPWPHSGASLTTFTAMTAIWLVIVQWISSALGGYLTLTGRLRTKCVGGLGRPGTPSFSRHGCSSAKGSKTRGVAPSYRRSWRNTRRRDRHPSLLRSFGRAPGHLRLGPQRDHPRGHPLAIDRPLARVKEMVARLTRGRTFPPAPWRQQLKTGGSKREAYEARLSWSTTEILARRFSLVQWLQPRLSVRLRIV